MNKSTKARVTLLGWIIFAAVTCLNAQETGPLAGKSWSLPLPGYAKLEMVWIPPGTFLMGSPPSEQGRKQDESPQATVTITKGYWMGKTEVTIGQWTALMDGGVRDQVIRMLADDSLYDLKGKRQTLRDFMGFSRQETDKVLANEDDSLPMYFVSWTDAMEFCQKLNNRENTAGRLPKGYEYTLPTEAQWEFACRAGSTTASFAGPVVIRDGKSAVLDNIAWYKANSALGYEGRGLDHPLAGPRQSGEKSPNARGLQDMLGNLWEWCLDWYGPYSGGQLTDPVGPGSGVERVNRGGSWGSGAADERSANRAANPPLEKSAYRGFRLALTRIPG
jgi:formylglycine-generating enzyme required for sulfatase activity